MDRPKFLRFYRDLELRVEQIGPNEWGSVLYGGYGCLIEGAAPAHQWIQAASDLTESAAKVGIFEVACKLKDREEGADSNWRDLSDLPDDDWNRKMIDRDFRGYPERRNFEPRWPGVLSYRVESE